MSYLRNYVHHPGTYIYGEQQNQLEIEYRLKLLTETGVKSLMLDELKLTILQCYNTGE